MKPSNTTGTVSGDIALRNKRLAAIHDKKLARLGPLSYFVYRIGAFLLALAALILFCFIPYFWWNQVQPTLTELLNNPFSSKFAEQVSWVVLYSAVALCATHILQTLADFLSDRWHGLWLPPLNNE